MEPPSHPSLLTTWTEVRRQLQATETLLEPIQATAWSVNGRFAAASDSYGSLAIVDCLSLVVKHHTLRIDTVYISSLAWTNSDGLLCGLSNGIVGRVEQVMDIEGVSRL